MNGEEADTAAKAARAWSAVHGRRSATLKSAVRPRPAKESHSATPAKKGGRGKGERAHDEKGREGAGFQDGAPAPAVARRGERDRSGKAERDGCAGRDDAEQSPQDDQRRQTEMDDEEGFYDVLHRRLEEIATGVCLQGKLWHHDD